LIENGNYLILKRKLRQRGQKDGWKNQNNKGYDQPTMLPFFHFTFKNKKETNSWFLKGGTGCTSHGLHVSKMTACLGHKTSLLTLDQHQGAIVDYAEATANARTTGKIMKFKSGIKLTHQQIHYIRQNVKKSELDSPGTSADKLLTYLQSCLDISLYCREEKRA
jgi:hypothetical protein